MSTATQHRLAEIRRGNLRTTVDALFADTSSLTLADLVDATALSRPTLTQMMRAMVDAGVATAAHVRPPSGIGRPMLQYKPVLTHHSLLVIRIEPSAVAMALADPTGEVYASHRVPVGEEHLPRRLLDTVDAAAREASGPVTAAVVAVMGIVHDGRVTRSDKHPSLEIPSTLDDLRAAVLAQWSEARTIVANDAKVAARYLHQCATTPEAPSHYAVAIHMASAVGCGIIVDGTVLDGAHGAAGEVGIISDGPWQDATDALAQGTDALGVDAATLFRMARDGDERAREVTRRVITKVAEGAGPIILTLDPDMVVLGGDIGETGPELGNVLESHLAGLGFTPPAIHVIEHSGDAIIRGAMLVAKETARESLAGELMTVDTVR